MHQQPDPVGESPVRGPPIGGVLPVAEVAGQGTGSDRTRDHQSSIAVQSARWSPVPGPVHTDGVTTLGYTLFDTAVGTCGLVWSAAGVVGVQLPETAPEPTRDALLGRFPAAVERPVPAGVQPVIDAVAAHLAGAPDDLRRVPVDYRNVSEFDTAVYEFARTVDPGAVATYGEVAPGRPAGRRPGRRTGVGTQPRSADRAVPPDPRRGRQDRRVLRARKHRHEAGAARPEHAPGFGDPTLF